MSQKTQRRLAFIASPGETVRQCKPGLFSLFWPFSSPETYTATDSSLPSILNFYILFWTQQHNLTMERDGLRPGALPGKYDGKQLGEVVIEHQKEIAMLTQDGKNSIRSSLTQRRGIVSGFLRHSRVIIDTNILQYTSNCIEEHKISNENDYTYADEMAPWVKALPPILIT